MKATHKVKEVSAADSKKLMEYVAGARSKGHSELRILKCLIDAGWPESIVSKFVGDSHTSHSAIIRCNSLTKSFGDHKILDQISMEISEGEIFGIIGLSGSGKTTLLNTVIGFLQPEEGEIFFRPAPGHEYISVFEKPTDVKKLFGFATQDPSYYTKLTAEENLDHFGSLYNLPATIRKTNVNLLLDLMGLTDSKRTLAENLSGGMQRRLGIGCSLIHDPKILILDEPTADLDPFLRTEMWNLIRKINQQGTTVIMSSHFLTEMEELCTKVAILHNQKIVEIGTPNELKEKFSKNDEIHLELASGNYDKFVKGLQRDKLDIKQITKSEGKLIIYTPKAEKVLHHILHIIERNKDGLIDVDVRKPSLREVFESLVKNDK